MKSLSRLLPACLAVALWSGTTQAAPFAPELNVKSGALEKVHGTHRSCRYSPASGWAHRHIGPYNRAVSCGYSGYDYDYDVTPFWFAPYYGRSIGPRIYRGRSIHRAPRIQRPVGGIHRGRRR